MYRNNLAVIVILDFQATILFVLQFVIILPVIYGIQKILKLLSLFRLT